MPAFADRTVLDLLIPCRGSQTGVPQAAYIQHNRPSTAFIEGSGKRTSGLRPTATAKRKSKPPLSSGQNSCREVGSPIETGPTQNNTGPALAK